MRATSRRPGGFTLVEMIVMIMILGMGMTGVMMAINRANRDSAVPFIRKQAIAIAESIMEEVTARNFVNNAATPSVDLAGAAAAQRNATHEVDDYNGFTMTGIRAPESPSTIITGLADYSVSVTVAATAFGTVPDTKSKLITVTVNGPADVQVRLEGFKIHYDGG